MKEAKIQSDILKFLISRGAIVNKTIGMSKAGWPDIIGVYKGKFIGIEVKRPGKKPTKLQEYKLHQLTRAGAETCVAVSLSDAVHFLSSIDNKDT